MCALLHRKEAIMPYYLINTQPDKNGRNEVHVATCTYLPDPSHRENLGYFPDEIAAVDYAKKHGYPNADGCYYCCPRAHHG